jgi:DNA-binding NarL/FixJ family response regulator
MTRVLILKDPEGFGVFDVDASPEMIVKAVNQGKSETYLPELEGRLYARVQADVVVITGEAPDPTHPLPRFSQREHEILVLLGEGLTTAQIAFQLKLSQRTIRGHVAKMKKRLKAQNIQQLVARAVALGLFHPEI